MKIPPHSKADFEKKRKVSAMFNPMVDKSIQWPIFMLRALKKTAKKNNEIPTVTG